MPEVRLTENLRDFGFGWTQVWQCDPPPEGVGYYVTTESWDEEFKTRTITAWRPATDTRSEIETR